MSKTKNNKKASLSTVPNEEEPFSLKDNLMKICHKIENFNPSKKNLEKEILQLYNFRTHNSRDIKYKLLNIANKVLLRNNAREEIDKMVNDMCIAIEIEKGIFEFSLIYVTNSKLPYHFIESVYNDKLNEICINLDKNNENIKNDTFLSLVKSHDFNSYFSSFLSPMQIFPNHWMSIINALKRKEDAMYERKTTDTYKCSRCKQRKFYVSEMQMRSADEPSNFFYTCAVCYKTFIK